MPSRTGEQCCVCAEYTWVDDRVRLWIPRRPGFICSEACAHLHYGPGVVLDITTFFYNRHDPKAPTLTVYNAMETPDDPSSSQSKRSRPSSPLQITVMDDASA